MSSTLGLERSPTSPTDSYDHAIGLVDSTKPKEEVVDSGDAASDSILVSNSSEGSQLHQQWTRPHLRKEIARRKYAKWQEEAEEQAVPRTSGETDNDNPKDDEAPKKTVKQSTWGTQGRLRDKVPFRHKKNKTKASARGTTFIDVLYENQRGSFLCGIPLYSAKSLLNFDPSGWQTSTFQDSPVNITNAQVPDPSWAWDWRTWYVDMSHDVDEEGWEYSFSFSPKFAWHGNHPWFHSFCRRRRWLRKRVKIHGRLSDKRENRNVKDEHKLNADYFTIHAPIRDRSRSTSGDRSATRRSSTMAGFEVVADDVEGMDAIPDIATLMTAIKRARVDREKIGAVKQFLCQGGDELFYLAENISLIMNDFVYQTSREHLQSRLLQSLDDAIRTRDSNKDDGDSSEKQEARTRRVNSLRKAVDEAGVSASDQGYLTILKARAAGEEDASIGNPPEPATTAGSRLGVRDDIAEHIEDEGEESGDEIKGISKDAEISVEPGIWRPDTATEDTSEQFEETKLDKGKGKEKA